MYGLHHLISCIILFMVSSVASPNLMPGEKVGSLIHPPTCSLAMNS